MYINPIDSLMRIDTELLMLYMDGVITQESCKRYRRKIVRKRRKIEKALKRKEEQE